MPVIPAPMRVTPGRGALRLRPEITVSCQDPALAAITGRFRADLERRTGIRTHATHAAHAAPGAAAGPATQPASAGPVGPATQPASAGPVGPATQPASAGPVGPATVTVGLGDVPELAGHPAPFGLHPAGRPADEAYTLTIGPEGARVLAREPAGAARGLTSLLQLAAATPPDADGRITLTARQVADAPRFAWRGLSLDVARRFFPPARIRQVIDLLALYKLNVLHLHLTDDEAWRIEPGRPAGAREPDGTFYTNAELRELAGYAADRFVSLVPEVDSPGHAAALMELRPELRTGRNQVSYRRAGGAWHHTAWLDPELPGAVAAIADVFAQLADVCPSPYVHVGGDEAWQMPEDAYREYTTQLLAALRDLGKRPVGWQELARAGTEAAEVADPEAIQYWMSPASFEALAEAGVPPETLAMVVANAARTRADIEQALRRRIPVIMSPSAHCYLDVPYAEESADPAQAARRDRVGLRHYPPLTLAGSFGWEPVAALGAGARGQDVAGVEAAMWGETVRDFDDLTFALLPRLAGVADRAWAAATTWAEHRDALGSHGRLWDQDGLTFFRAQGVGWR